MIEGALYTRLCSALSTDVGTRVYPLVAPERFVSPLAVYNTVSADLHQYLEGASDLMRTGLQVDVYAATYALAKSMAKKVRKSMTTWEVPLSLFVDDAGTDMIEKTVTPNLYRVSMRFIVEHEDA